MKKKILALSMSIFCTTGAWAQNSDSPFVDANMSDLEVLKGGQWVTPCLPVPTASKMPAKSTITILTFEEDVFNPDSVVFNQNNLFFLDDKCTMDGIVAIQGANFVNFKPQQKIETPPANGSEGTNLLLINEMYIFQETLAVIPEAIPLFSKALGVDIPKDGKLSKIYESNDDAKLTSIFGISDIKNDDKMMKVLTMLAFEIDEVTKEPKLVPLSAPFLKVEQTEQAESAGSETTTP